MSGRASGRMSATTDRIKHFRASDDDAEYAGFDEDQRHVEVRYDREQESSDPNAWTVDEIVMAGVHLEAMDVDSVWMDLNGLSVWLRAVRVKGERRPRLIVTCYPNACTPVVVEQETTS